MQALYTPGCMLIFGSADLLFKPLVRTTCKAAMTVVAVKRTL